LHSTSIVASSAANIAKSLAAKLLVLARFASRLTSPSNITASNSSIAIISAAAYILTPPNYISIISLAIYITLSSI
jgi:hypothetical protein